MSENLKRAESLFNRIMNQNGESSGFAPKSLGPYKHGSLYAGQGKGSHKLPRQLTSGPSGMRANETSSFITQQVAMSLPRRDPAAVAREAVDAVPDHHHVLPYCWTIWYHMRGKLKQRDEGDDAVATADAVDSYLQTTCEVDFATPFGPETTTKCIASLEQMWWTLAQLKKVYELRSGTELLIFKSGVHPVWEDPVNTQGGRWVFRFNNRKMSGLLEDAKQHNLCRQRTCLIWERLVLKIMLGQLMPEGDPDVSATIANDIVGMVLSVRKDDDIISVWNLNANFASSPTTATNTATLKNGGDEADKTDDGGKNETRPTAFQARRLICDAILRVVRECDMVMAGEDPIAATDLGSNERVQGASFDYRLHSDNNADGATFKPSKYNSNYSGQRRYPKHRRKS